MASRKRTMISPRKDGLLHGRRLEFFHHEALKEWNTPGQMDSFALIHPRRKKRKTPLYVVLHSAGHDLYSCIGCSVFKNNHDIYRTPEDFFGLYLDCRAHESTDFWWGGINAKGDGAPERKVQVQNVEKRVYATIEWVMTRYPVDPERVYICGNSMGGSGALGLGMCRGDLFAAVKVNVPAGVEIVSVLSTSLSVTVIFIVSPSAFTEACTSGRISPCDISEGSEDSPPEEVILAPEGSMVLKTAATDSATSRVTASFVMQACSCAGSSP